MFEVLLHLIDMLFEHYEEIVHFYGLTKELTYLAVLVIDCCLCDISDEAEVLLDANEQILRGEAGQKWKFSL